MGRTGSGSARKPQRGDTEKSQVWKLLYGNDTEGRDGFVKMAEFQLLHRTISQLIRLVKVRYSGSFLSKSEKERTLTTKDTKKHEGKPYH